MTNGFDLDHNFHLWSFKVKRDHLWPHTWPWPWIFMVKFWNSCISEWEGQFTLHKGGGSRPFMAMTMTIWWPRLDVWIYQLVTGVTSVIGVPSNQLVHYIPWNKHTCVVLSITILLSDPYDTFTHIIQVASLVPQKPHQNRTKWKTSIQFFHISCWESNYVTYIIFLLIPYNRCTNSSPYKVEYRCLLFLIIAVL